MKYPPQYSNPKPWFVYIVTNDASLLYTGVTTDPERRLREHNGWTKGARYTRGKGPWRLVYLEPVPDQTTALKREYVIKHLRRAQKLELIKSSDAEACHQDREGL